MIRHLLLALALLAPSTSHADPSVLGHANSLVLGKVPVVRVIIEIDGEQKFALRCPTGNFTLKHNGNDDSAAAAVFRGDAIDGELTPSGIIACEKRKD